MVGKRAITLLALLLGTNLLVWAQNYQPNDTVTEYPVKGTYYHYKFEGRKTSSGEVFDQNLFTAAHWKIKLGTYIMVTSKNTGQQVIVKVNDRCPRKGIIDMTRRAASSIGIKGCQPVTVRLLSGDYSEQCAAQDKMFDSVPSRFASGELAMKAAQLKSGKVSYSKLVSSDKSSEEKTIATPATLPVSTKKTDQYNLQLGSAQTFGEAFDMLKALPEQYQNKVIVDSVTDDFITVFLDVRLSKKRAQELSRALKHSFKECKITPSE